MFLRKEHITDFGSKAELHNEEVRCRLAEYIKMKKLETMALERS